jgi:hypothetical protein
MKQIVRDQTAYYLLGYSSAQTTDGKFHEIKVRVKRPGVVVRARRGYWALTATEVRNSLAPKPDPPKAFERALAAISQPAASHALIRTWIGSSRGDEGKTKVTFVWEPSSRERAGRTEAPARVLLTAIGPDGSPYFRGRVTDRATFDAAPGKIQLRMSVEGAAAQVLDSDAREITVPDLTSLGPTLATPEVFRARTARELQQIKADAAPVPAATREFSRTERLLVRVAAYGPGRTAPMVSARVLNRGDMPIMEVPVTPSDRPGVQQMEVQLSALAPGEYVLEIKAAGDSAGATELVGFRVTG